MAKKATSPLSLRELKHFYKMVIDAQKKGFIPYPTQCDFCPQDKGIIRLHSEDFSIVLKVLPDLLNGTHLPDNQLLRKIKTCFIQLCYRCDMMYHSKELDPEAYSIYIQQIKDGVVFSPVYEHDYETLIKDHGIGNKGLISS